MTLYTFENPSSLSTISKKIVVVDTSYLIALTDTTDNRNPTISSFHKSSLNNGTQFYINVIVRMEFIKSIRKAQFVDAILKLAGNDPLIETRYRNITGQRSNFSSESIKNNYDKIYKNHLKQGDLHRLQNEITINIWETVNKIEKDTQVEYLSGAGNVSWEDLGALMQTTGLDSTDAMISNFAFHIGADAIVTTDVDYVQLRNVMDVYLPAYTVNQCSYLTI